eukprot:6462788-Amphidinium_carterae.1
MGRSCIDKTHAALEMAKGNEHCNIKDVALKKRWQRYAGTIQGFSQMAPESKLGLKRAWLSKMWEEADTVMARKRKVEEEAEQALD